MQRQEQALHRGVGTSKPVRRSWSTMTDDPMDGEKDRGATGYRCPECGEEFELLGEKLDHLRESDCLSNT